MFIEKFSRFFRQYDLTFRPRKSKAPFLPLFDKAGMPSIYDAINQRLDAEKALEVQSNGDVVELMRMDRSSEALTLLFHRASPNSADPMYRKKARQAAGVTVTLRQAKREQGEEPSVSAHLVIRTKSSNPGVYQSALEEIPGLNMSVIKRIIAVALSDYPFGFTKNNKDDETYTVMRAVGIKSETLTNALKTGNLGYVTLSRPAKADFVDADFQPTRETMKLRIKGDITPKNWRGKFSSLLAGGKKAGWTDFAVDLSFDDKRKRTVAIDRQEEAQEILFVRSEQVAFKKELVPCTNTVNRETVAHALDIIKAV